MRPPGAVVEAIKPIRNVPVTFTINQCPHREGLSEPLRDHARQPVTSRTAQGAAERNPKVFHLQVTLL